MHGLFRPICLHVHALCPCYGFLQQPHVTAVPAPLLQNEAML